MDINIGRFKLQAPLATGSMGEIWRGIHLPDGMPVAIKLIHLPDGDRETYRATFRRELMSIARLSHPNIVALFDYGELPANAPMLSGGQLQADLPYFVTEFANGGSLDVHPPRNWDDVRQTLLTVLDALAHAHARGVLHRDLKPGNILVCTANDLRPGLKIADFGISHSLTAVGPSGAEDILTSKTREMPIGTPSYMAPEQFKGRWRDYGPWTDLYSLGIMAWQFVCGRLPFRERSFFELGRYHTEENLPSFSPVMDLPQGVDGWIARLTAKRSSERFQSAMDAAWALSALDAKHHTDLGRLQLYMRTAADGLATETKPQMGNWRMSYEEGNERPNDTARRVVRQLSGAGVRLFGLREIPMVGREQEREALWEALRQVDQTQQPQVLLLKGKTGVGTSRLAQWLCERADELGAATPLKASHQTSEDPRHGLARMISAHYRCTGLPRDKMLARLETILRDQGVTDPHEWTRLQMVLRRQSKPDPHVTLGHSLRTLRPDVCYALLGRLLTRMSRKKPLIVWLDDVHSGIDSLMFMEAFLAQSHEQASVLFVLTFNPEVLVGRPDCRDMLARLETRPDTDAIELGALDVGAFQTLVQNLLCLSEPLTQEIAAKAGGNPLYAIQLMNDWIDRDVLSLSKDGFVARDNASLNLPSNYQAIWTSFLQRHLNNSPEQARHALEIAVALRGGFQAEEFTHACQTLGFAPPWTTIEAMESHGLMERRDGIWAFTKAVVAESIETHARDAMRWATINRTCATMLKELYTDLHPGTFQRRAYHLLEAKDLTQAAELFLAAANEEIEADDHEQAIELLDTRLAILDALRSSDPKADRSKKDPKRIEGWCMRAKALCLNYELDYARTWAERCVQAATAHGNPLLCAEASAVLALVAEYQGRTDEACTLNKKALTNFESAHTPRRAAEVLVRIASIKLRSGHLKKAMASYNKAHDHPGAKDNPLTRGHALMGLAHIYRQRQNLTQAEKLYFQALPWFRQVEAWHEEAMCTVGLGHIKRTKGELGHAAKHYAKAAASLNGLHSPDFATVSLYQNLLLIAHEDYVQTYQNIHNLLPKLLDSPQGLTLAHTFLLPALAHVAEPSAWSEHFQATRQLLNQTHLVDIDIAHCAQLAGAQMFALHQRDHARDAYTLAIEQYKALGQTKPAKLLTATLASWA